MLVRKIPVTVLHCKDQGRRKVSVKVNFLIDVCDELLDDHLKHLKIAVLKGKKQNWTVDMALENVIFAFQDLLEQNLNVSAFCKLVVLNLIKMNISEKE